MVTCVLVRFLYYEECQIQANNVMQILYASKKYMIPAMTKKCTTYLEQKLDTNNVCTIFQQSLLYDEKTLAEKCKEIIQKQTAKVFKSDGFQSISKDTLIHILNDDELSIKEIEVFEFCLQWARAHAVHHFGKGQVLRDALGEAFFQIRFPLMTVEEFGSVVVHHELLTQAEENSCFRYLSQKGKGSLTPVGLRFPTKPRLGNQESKMLWLVPNASVTHITENLGQKSVELIIKNYSNTPIDIVSLATKYSYISRIQKLDNNRSDDVHHAFHCQQNKKWFNVPFTEEESSDNTTIFNVDRLQLSWSNTIRLKLDMNYYNGKICINSAAYSNQHFEVKVTAVGEANGIPISAIRLRKPESIKPVTEKKGTFETLNF